jgi:hypothetical protein
MALKRFSEYREISNTITAGSYRRSFAYYSERSLLVSVIFYASAGMLFFGAFIIRYRIELVLAFPLVAVVMAIYCNLAFDRDSCVQNPEKLHREKRLMIAVILCAALMTALLFIDIPALNELFSPSIPVQRSWCGPSGSEAAASVSYALEKSAAFWNRNLYVWNRGLHFA